MKNINNLFSLEGKNALVTGSTGFLGHSMAFALAKAGAHILVNSRSYNRAMSLVKKLNDAKYSAETFVCDITNEDQLKNSMKTFVNKPLHILINNAYSGEGGTIKTATTQEYRQSYEVTIVAAHNLLRFAFPALCLAKDQSGDASVINISSMYGLVSPDLRVYDSPIGSNPPFYGASKAALIQWTRYAACEYGTRGVRVNSISPGPFPNNAVKKANPSFVEYLGSRVPLGRVGLAEELQGPIVFLASHASSYINGANLVVDGGWTAW